MENECNGGFLFISHSHKDMDKKNGGFPFKEILFGLPKCSVLIIGWGPFPLIFIVISEMKLKGIKI